MAHMRVPMFSTNALLGIKHQHVMGSVLFEELGLFDCSKGSGVEEGLDFWNVSRFRRTVLGIAAHFAELAEPSCNHQRDGPSLSLTKQRSTYASTFQTDAVLYL